MSNRERFEAWYLAKYWLGSDSGRAYLGKEDCGGYTYAMPQELWEVWQAAQPAAGEPVAWQERAGLRVARDALENGRYDFGSAPPAAAHGDEAVLRDMFAKGWYAGVGRLDTSATYFTVACDQAIATMRAQAGEGGEV